MRQTRCQRRLAAHRSSAENPHRSPGVPWQAKSGDRARSIQVQLPSMRGTRDFARRGAAGRRSEPCASQVQLLGARCDRFGSPRGRWRAARGGRAHAPFCLTAAEPTQEPRAMGGGQRPHAPHLCDATRTSLKRAGALTECALCMIHDEDVTSVYCNLIDPEVRTCASQPGSRQHVAVQVARRVTRTRVVFAQVHCVVGQLKRRKRPSAGCVSMKPSIRRYSALRAAR